MNIWIDTHAHVYLEEFSKDRDEMLSRCAEYGVEKIFMPNVDHASIESMLRTEEESQGICHAMMGLHPCSVKNDFEKELYTIETWLRRRNFAAVGEIGTDLYWDKTYWEQQKEAFVIQVNWAREFKLPVVIHCRESLDQTIDLIEELQDGSLTGVFHCFGGTVEQAARISNLGFFLGIGGVVTFKKAGLDKVLPQVSLDKLVLETDSPYLAPVPYRGKRNEPSYLPLIAKQIAEFKSVNLQEVKSTTTRNALKLFNQSI